MITSGNKCQKGSFTSPMSSVVEGVCDLLELLEVKLDTNSYRNKQTHNATFMRLTEYTPIHECL